MKAGVGVLVLVQAWAVLARSGFEGIPGDYCRNRRPSECCDDRWDDCAVPIRGTLCYCDQFCYNSGSPVNDCCPDFEDVCMKRPPLPPVPLPPVPLQDSPAKDCEVRGVTIPLGASHSFNCNKCECQGDGIVSCENDPCMVEADLIRQVNTGMYGWLATNHSQYWGRKTKEGLVLKTGTEEPDIQTQMMNPVLMRPVRTKIPPHFDARQTWMGRVTGVRDQGWCGASWAFSTIEVAQDRVNIAAEGTSPVALSSQELLSCSSLGHDGCHGGQVAQAWNFLRKTGVPLEECHHYESGLSSKVPPCSPQREAENNPNCKNRYMLEPSYRVSSREEDIQWEILHNGPVQAMMRVYPDLFMYETGVYRHTGLGGDTWAHHSVKVLGWGTMRTRAGLVRYWLVQNSWGREWGERGLFKIERGVNECGIESFVLAARAPVQNAMYGH